MVGEKQSCELLLTTSLQFALRNTYTICVQTSEFDDKNKANSLLVDELLSAE